MSPADYRRACNAEAAGIIADRREPLPLELLIPASKRRVSIQDHADWRESIAPRPPLDPVDEYVEILAAEDPRTSTPTHAR